MRFLDSAARWLLVLCIPPLLLSASIAAALNCRGLYEYGFRKYNISQVTGLAPAELSKAAAGLIRYFNSGEEYIRVTVIKDGKSFPLFNDREVAHLKDVKALFRLDYAILLVTALYALAYSAGYLIRRREKRRFLRAVFRGSVLTLVMIFVLGLLAVSDFPRFFWTFHLLSFANDFWLLDPTRDYLIMLFPEGFWFDATLACALGAVAGALILGAVSGICLRRDGETTDRSSGSGCK
ncbi:MAG: TIGR01906 family membrane protein [Chloroflexota bacterium]